MDLVQYKERRVRLTRNLKEKNAEGHLADELDGVITHVAPNGSAILLKPRGSTQTILIEADSIEPDSIVIVTEKPKEHKPRVLGMLSLSNARQHLLMTHGLSLKLINSLDDHDAHKYHTGLDHGDLGHVHQDQLAGEGSEG